MVKKLTIITMLIILCIFAVRPVFANVHIYSKGTCTDLVIGFDIFNYNTVNYDMKSIARNFMYSTYRTNYVKNFRIVYAARNGLFLYSITNIETNKPVYAVITSSLFISQLYLMENFVDAYTRLFK